VRRRRPAIIFNDLHTTNESVLLSYTAMAATRYGGMPLTPVDNGTLSYAQLLYPDIDRRGNLLNQLHNNLGTQLLDGRIDRASLA